MTVTPESTVQAQLEAYNARDLARFVQWYAEGVRLHRMPDGEPAIRGRAELAAFYAAHRFNRPGLRADVLARVVLGDKVIDHERIFGVQEQPFEMAIVYQVIDGLIANVWSFPP